MKRDIHDNSFLEQVPRSTHENATINFLENIEIKLFEKWLFEVELERENRNMAKKLLRGPLKSVAVRRDLERIAGTLQDENDQFSMNFFDQLSGQVLVITSIE